jgi:hypothetical protein
MILRPLFLALACALLGCAGTPILDGPPRSSPEMARLGPLPVFRGFHAFLFESEPAEIVLVELDGVVLPRNCTRVELEPGPHVLLASTGGSGTRYGYRMERELRFEAQAGADYRIVYAEDDRDLQGILRIVVTDSGEVVADTRPTLESLAFAPLPALAQDWLQVTSYVDLDPSLPYGVDQSVRTAAFVPPHESDSAWSRRLELAVYGTLLAGPPLDAVAIDLERCQRSRFTHVSWIPVRDVGGASVQRWTASNGSPAEALDGLTVLRAGPQRVWVATLAARGDALTPSEVEAWTSALLDLQPEPLADVLP